MAQDSQKLDLYRQRYRVMQGEEIIAQFSNRQLAEYTATFLPGAIVLDISVEPPKVVYKEGKWMEQSA